jgi:two-component system CheB/CheR fusion protein
VDFRSYRDTTIRRRVMRRMVLHGKKNLPDYLRMLEQNAPEIEALYQDILINVTSFFRETEAFEALKQQVFPAVVSTKNRGAAIRIWVPGCSSGQEAYTLAMVLLEFLDDRNLRLPVQIFATDLSDTVSLLKAREGLYPDSIEAEVTPERLRRFFTREDGKYRVVKGLRDLCVFAKQNVAADPPFSRVDLISCRNLLIYMAPSLQKRVIPTFHYALNPNGFLMLGSSETIGSFGDLFAVVDHKNRIYSKKITAYRQYPIFRPDEFTMTASGIQRQAPIAIAPADWQREADRLVLGQYSPAGALVNHDFDVLQFRGKTGQYLTPAPGEASFNILKMAREGLFMELRSALSECREHHQEVVRHNVHLRTETDMRTIDIKVVPLALPGIQERCFLVLFEDHSDNPGYAARHAEDAGPGGMRARIGRWLASPAEAKAGEQDTQSGEVASLRQELASTREYLQSVIEQQDAANEELKSANEEILSSNEELQSTNEELETAKEELQSVNEELTTINEQLQNRNAELARLNDDITNLLSSASVPMVSLGVDLRIRRFTPAAARLLNLLSTDVGRPISNINLSVQIPDLGDLVASVVDTVRTQEREVSDRSGRHYLLRTHPYRTADNRIDGAVLVLHDGVEPIEPPARPVQPD